MCRLAIYPLPSPSLVLKDPFPLVVLLSDIFILIPHVYPFYIPRIHSGISNIHTEEHINQWQAILAYQPSYHTGIQGFITTFILRILLSLSCNYMVIYIYLFSDFYLLTYDPIRSYLDPAESQVYCVWRSFTT